jgi:tripartite-type tricarboxylate transporter receptor subunit TctC
MTTRRFLAALLGAVFFGGLLAAHAADPFPTRPVKLLIGFAPGGSSDTVARIMAPRMGELLKQSVVIENRPGAGGNIASEQLVKAPADGYTIMLGTIGSLAVNQHINKLGYNPVTDMQALSMAIVFPNVLVVNANSDIRSLDDYVRQGKAERSRASFGSSGIGSAGHLAGELFKATANLNNQHVAYRGGAPAMNDLLGGVLPSIFSSPTDAMQFIQNGKLRPLAVTSAKRMEVLPNVPTIAELGYSGFEAVNWYAFTAPLRTPPEVVKRLNEVITTTLSDPQIAAQLRKLGLVPTPTSPEDTARYMRAESDKWGAIVRKAGISGD